MKAKLIETIETGDTLGEGVLWRASDRTVWWTDIEGRRLHRLAWPSLALDTFPLPERLGSFAFLDGTDATLLGAFEDGFAAFEPGRPLRWIARLPEIADGMRMNDGRVAPDGAFWAGAMVERGDGEGFLLRLGTDGTVTREREGLVIPNGLCWSPDGRTVYSADSALGTVSRRRDAGPWEAFARPEGGAPDGAVTDATGRYWCALWGGEAVGVFSDDGARIAEVEVPAPHVTCPAFGGDDLGLLFVTSARADLDDRALAAAPRSGSLFVFETDAVGREGHRAALAQSLR